MSDSLLLQHLSTSGGVSSDDLLDRFLEYTSAAGLSLYPAQEEAILALYEGSNVILSTPTGSGKSLVAVAWIFRALALGRRAVYTCPIKALVNEKFLALCQVFGPDRVGLATGDATVNREAPVLCCTAEILSNDALRGGAGTNFADVVMDEFHYYSDRDRGVAWQVPLLTMRCARFLLMSATLGDTRFFEQGLTRLTGAPTVPVTGSLRPVPLEFRYVETPVSSTVQDLLADNLAPVYLVHFSQNDAAQSAQDMMSLNYCTPSEKAAIKDAMAGVKFSSPYGKDVKKYLAHGIGLHHAGMLPKYRVLVERLAQQGLLKLICGTDTLGVGVNVPIRTVLLTRLTKYSGDKVAVLTARDFHQIVGRAGRKGFDDIGYVVAQAPEHVVENAKLEAKAAGDDKKRRKLVKKRAPEGFVGWSAETFERLQKAAPEPLVSRFEVGHGMLLQVLQRPGDGCHAMQKLIADSHEPPVAKVRHRQRAWQLFRSLRERGIVEIVPPTRRDGGPKLRLKVDLQEDFSLNHALSLYLIDTLALIDPASVDYAADVLTLCESILENPDIILRRQLDKLKTEEMNRMKADGVAFEDRLARLEELEYPKPCRNFIYDTFNEFAARHPWVERENIRPKSIAREMWENFRTFADYISDYDLHRVEGVLLRHLSSTWKVLAQTVPEPAKNEAVQEMEAWLAGVVRGIDSSLLDEWERMRNPDWKPDAQGGNEPDTADITRNPREFTALIRTEIFRFLRALDRGDFSGACTLVAEGWNAVSLEEAFDPYFDEHERLLLDAEGRNGRHTQVDVAEDRRAWTVSQILTDPEGLNDWQVVFRVDLETARAEGRPVLILETMGEV
ncbi:MAG: DUF3516 domain-containing protein [Akkermansiaceae bacterium]|nr:DUF3516 domain-containing protein [Akkermansiaceae bacterium]